MVNLITKSEYINSNEYTNDLTREIDKHLSGNYPNYITTYIYGNKPNEYGWLSFRFPGATRGGIKVDSDNIITDIRFDKSRASFIYDDSVEDAVKKFIGYKIIIVDQCTRD